MKTIKEVLALFPSTTEADWKQHPIGKGWMQITAYVEATTTIEGIVSGRAQVSGNARVSGKAQVSGNAWETSPLYIQGSVHAATNCKFGSIAIGCKVHTFVEWQEKFETIGKENGYTKEQIAEYKAIIDLMVKVGR